MMPTPYFRGMAEPEWPKGEKNTLEFPSNASLTLVQYRSVTYSGRLLRLLGQ